MPRKQSGMADKLHFVISNLDAVAVNGAAWCVGTGHRLPSVRRLRVAVTLLAIAIGSAVVPWPWGFLLLTIGVTAIIGVLRHWSLLQAMTTKKRKFNNWKLALSDDLNIEIAISAFFMLVYANIAENIILTTKLDVRIINDLGGITSFMNFVTNSLIKNLSFDFFDAFGHRSISIPESDSVGMDGLSGWTVAGYRASVNVLGVAVLTHLLGIARRKEDSVELQHIEDLLRTEGGVTSDDLRSDVASLVENWPTRMQQALGRLVATGQAQGNFDAIMLQDSLELLDPTAIINHNCELQVINDSGRRNLNSVGIRFSQSGKLEMTASADELRKLVHIIAKNKTPRAIRFDGTPSTAVIGCVLGNSRAASSGASEQLLFLRILPIRPRVPLPAVLRNLYDLTHAEAEVAALVAVGMSSEEIAKKRGKIHATVRSQIQTVLEKLGVHSQRELLTVLSCVGEPPAPH